MNFKERSQFHFDVLNKNISIARKISEMKSRLPDRDGVKQMVKAHDDYSALASRHKGTLPSLDPLIRRKISVDMQHVPLLDLPQIAKSNRAASLLDNLVDRDKPGNSTLTKVPTARELLAEFSPDPRHKSLYQMTSEYALFGKEHKHE